jgi:hypothetical protein
MSAPGFDRTAPAIHRLFVPASAHGALSGGGFWRAAARLSAPPASRRRLLSGTVADSAADRLDALIRNLAPFPLQDG